MEDRPGKEVVSETTGKIWRRVKDATEKENEGACNLVQYLVTSPLCLAWPELQSLTPGPATADLGGAAGTRRGRHRSADQTLDPESLDEQICEIKVKLSSSELADCSAVHPATTPSSPRFLGCIWLRDWASGRPGPRSRSISNVVGIDGIVVSTAPFHQQRSLGE